MTMTSERIAIVGSLKFRDTMEVKRWIKTLDPDTVVIVPEENGPVDMAAVRQAGCHHLLCYRVRAPRRTGTYDGRERQYRAVFEEATRVMVFGPLEDWQERVLEQVVEYRQVLRGELLPVERVELDPTIRS